MNDQEGASTCQPKIRDTVNDYNKSIIDTNVETTELVASQHSTLVAGQDTTPGFSENSARSEAQVQSQKNFDSGDIEQPGFSGNSPARGKRRAIIKRKRRRSPSMSESSLGEESGDSHSSSCSGSNSSDEESQHESEVDQEIRPAKIRRFRAKSTEGKNK